MHLHPFEQILTAGLLMAGLMLFLWFYQRASGDAGIVDIAWSAGLGMLAILYAVTSDGYAPRRALMAVLAAVWSFRLALYLYFRNHGKEEDGRYRTLRKNWGSNVQVFFFFFFQGQAFLDVLFSLPFLVVAHNPFPKLAWFDFAGVLVLASSIAGETVADWQLARFRENRRNRGKTCRDGLWRYSRHPNYFFEWLHWWSYVLMAVGAEHWWVTFLGPALMLLFLFKVTGIPATEEQALKSRGEDYRRYQKTTSAFFPWFPEEERE